MTKLELQQRNTVLATENDALRAELSRLETQLTAPSNGRVSFIAKLAELRAAGRGAKLVNGQVVKG